MWPLSGVIGPLSRAIGPSIGPLSRVIGPSIGPLSGVIGPSIGPLSGVMWPLSGVIGPLSRAIGPSIGPLSRVIGPSIGPLFIGATNMAESPTGGALIGSANPVEAPRFVTIRALVVLIFSTARRKVLSGITMSWASDTWLRVISYRPAASIRSRRAL